MTWLERLLNQHSELESPMNFWLWGGIAAISAVLKDNVWIDRQIYNLYPNIYVMLHADSGLKKGPPVSMAKQLVSAVGGTHIISGRSSIQGILKEMGSSETQKGGKVVSKNVVFICSSELTSSIVSDPVAMDILTDLYDRQYNLGEWRSLLKMESFSLKNPTVSMLTATNPAHSTEFFSKKDIHGGYFARTFVIAEHKRNRANSLLVSLGNQPNYTDMAQYLKELSSLKGPFKPLANRLAPMDGCHIPHKDPLTGETHYYTEAGIMYQLWYEEFVEETQAEDMKDETGTLNRFGDSVLKVAMIFSLARSPELYIDEGSMNLAIEHCKKLVGNIRHMSLGRQGMSDSSALKAAIIKELASLENPRISRQMLLKKMWQHYKEAHELDEIMLSFDQAGMIKTESIGNQIVYIMDENTVQGLKRMWSGRNK